MRERSTAYLTVTFKDKNGAAAIPSSIVYRVDCATTGEALRAETAIVPASQVEITVNADENAIRNEANKTEVRCVTVVATYGDSTDRVSDSFEYKVENLRFL
jgi:hypothetical protein